MKTREILSPNTDPYIQWLKSFTKSIYTSIQHSQTKGVFQVDANGDYDW